MPMEAAGWLAVILFLMAILFLFVLVYLITYIVPGYSYDVPEILGRVGRTKKSGLRLQFPLLTKHRFVTTKAGLLSDKIVFIAADGVQVTAPINMLVSADADVNIPYGD